MVGPFGCRVLDALRGRSGGEASVSDRNLIEAQVVRIVVERARITLSIIHETGQSSDGEGGAPTLINIPFTVSHPVSKGIRHAPAAIDMIDEQTRNALLTAIARSCGWMNAILTGETASFDEIAASEKLAERYVRRLSVFAYLSPKIVAAIDQLSAPATMSIRSLTQPLPMKWAEQEALRHTLAGAFQNPDTAKKELETGRKSCPSRAH